MGEKGKKIQMMRVEKNDEKRWLIRLHRRCQDDNELDPE
jgi:hypothetical protein